MEYCLYQKGEEYLSVASDNFSALIPFIEPCLKACGEVTIKLENLKEDYYFCDIDNFEKEMPF